MKNWDKNKNTPKNTQSVCFLGKNKNELRRVCVLRFLSSLLVYIPTYCKWQRFSLPVGNLLFLPHFQRKMLYTRSCCVCVWGEVCFPFFLKGRKKVNTRRTPHVCKKIHCFPRRIYYSEKIIKRETRGGGKKENPEKIRDALLY